MNTITGKLLQWYRENQRDLPWRKTKDPYAIMVSEIMLQQTRVNTVIAYYHRFLERFPTIAALADAPEDDVLNLWKGLGYYSRARNLHKAAKKILHEYNGLFPTDIEKVKKLPGIGDYTAGAIMSIAFGKPHAAVDGNVLRAISRIHGISEDITLPETKQAITALVSDMMHEDSASDFTQSLMELGAMVCTPKNPLCDQCPIADSCYANINQITDSLPVKQKKKKPQTLFYYALLLIHEGHILMTRNSRQTLLKDMWGIPLLDPCTDDQLADQILSVTGIQANSFQKIGKVKHVFTHRIWELDVVICQDCTSVISSPDYQWILISNIKHLAVPTAFEKVLRFAITE